jgi:hypothetical protein
MSSRDGVPMLSLDELRKIADDLREDLQRQANQGIRKKDWEQGIGSLASMEAVGEFIRLCEQRARMNADIEQRVVERAERRKPGSNVTRLPAPVPAVRKRQTKQGADPDTIPGWARERMKG